MVKSKWCLYFYCLYFKNKVGATYIKNRTITKDLRTVIYMICTKGPAPGTCKKNIAHLRFSTCARPAIFLLEVTLVPKVTMANSNSLINDGQLVANIVNHPDFRLTLANILQSPSSLNTASNDSNTIATASGSLGARPW